MSSYSNLTLCAFEEALDDTFWRVYWLDQLSVCKVCEVSLLFASNIASLSKWRNCLHSIFSFAIDPSLLSGMSWYLANKCLSQIEGDGQLNAVKNTCISIGAALKSFKKRPNHTFLSRHSIPSLGKIFSNLPFPHIFHENYSLSAVVGHSAVQCCS